MAISSSPSVNDVALLMCLLVLRLCLPLSHPGCDLTYGAVLAPLASLESLVGNRFCMFLWRVGSGSWSQHPLDGLRGLQIVVFKGVIFAMDYLRRLLIIRLVPQLCVEELAVVWEQDMFERFSFQPWLVVCGDMLLLVNHSVSFPVGPATYQVFQLDLSTAPAKWVKVEKLDKWALFLDNDRRSLTFACMNPERWGGKSDRIYHACPSGRWMLTPLSHRTMPSETSFLRQYFGDNEASSVQMEPRWVFPSMFSFASQ